MWFKKAKFLSLCMIVLLVSLVGGVAGAVSPIPTDTDIVADIVEKVSPAVVNIDTLKIATYTSPFTPF